MADPSDIIARLSPEKKALLLSLLQSEAEPWQEDRIGQRPVGDALPMSAAQERLWFIEQLHPGTTQYIIPAILRVRGPLQSDAVRQALQEIWQRHGGLRVNFIPGEDGPVQIRNTAAGPEFRMTEGVLPERGDGHERGLPAVASFLRRPFDLSRDTLLRALLIDAGPEDHLLLIAVHHIVFDGWSTGVFLGEFRGYYLHHAGGRAFEPEPCLLEYADYAWWERATITGERLAGHLAFWSKFLAGAPPVLSLPVDRPRAPVRSPAGRRERFVIGPEITPELRVLATGSDATLTMVLLAAWCVLLQRSCDTADLVVGMPVANRGCAQTEAMIGLFVNTLPFRCSCGRDEPFTVVLRRVREGLMDILAHQEVPFDKIVEELRVERDQRMHPLFQVMFDVQTAPLRGFTLPGLEVALVDPGRDTAKFDLLLTIEDDHDRLICAIEYATDIFDAWTVRGMARCYAELLQSIVDDPSASCGRLPIVPAAVLAGMDRECNRDRAAVSGPFTIPALFERQVARTPHATAVWSDGVSLTFERLNERANHLAWRLRVLGLRPEESVAILLERSVDWVTAVLGILKAGGAYAPLDPSYPPDRTAQVLGGAGIRVVVAEAGTLDLLPRGGLAVVRIESVSEGLPAEAGADRESGLHPENIAYVIHTSGSTGTPKGVMISHRSAVNLWAGLQRVIFEGRVSRPLRVSLNAPLAFDASVQQLLMLCGGHCIHVVPGSIRRDGEALCAWVREHRIDLLDCVPSQLAMLVEAGLLTGEEWHPSILLPGGEAIGMSLWRTLAASADVATFNMYGPTECTVDPCICPVHASPETPSIGRPIVNLRASILDASFRPVPPGVPGELFLSGAGVGRGYLARPDLTAERFLPDPGALEPGGRMYRTGDMVRMREGGWLEFIGRLDNQVKVRGQRIEPGEIDGVLRGHDGVLDALTLVSEPAPGNQQLVSYVIARDGVELRGSVLRHHVRQKLPPYMVPALFIVLDAFPLTPNGKVDRKRLPPPSVVPEPDEPDGREMDPVERILAGIWESVLGIRHAGPADNFFALGGHSLNAGRIITRVRLAFGVDLPLQAVFECQTLADLARRITAVRMNERVPSPVPVPRHPGQVFPLSFGQQRLWFLDQMDPGSPLYNVSAAMAVRGPMDVDALQAAVDALIVRHEVLRTEIVTGVAEGVQRVLPAVRCPLRQVDLDTGNSDENTTVLQQLMEREARVPFVLSCPPLMRCVVYRLDERHHVLQLTMHHIISDGWSMEVMVREVGALYAAEREQKPPDLPALEVQYADYAAWQRSPAWERRREGLIAHWRSVLEGGPAELLLPADAPRPAELPHDGGRLPVVVDPVLTGRVMEFCRQEDVTPFMTLLACYAVLLHRITGQSDITVGTPVANRQDALVEPLIGFFVNTVVLRIRPQPAMTFRAFVRQIRTMVLDALAHQDLPFEALVDALRPARSLHQAPLFQTMFVFQESLGSAPPFGGLETEEIPVETGTAKYDLTLVLEDTRPSLRGWFEYAAALFRPETIRRLGENFGVLIADAVGQADRPIGALECLSPRERQMVLVGFSRGAVVPLPGTSVTAWIRRHAHERPDAVALVEGDRSWTFAALWEEVAQVAGALRERGVTHETMVAVLLDQSAEYIIAVTAILAAGGAFVPLDSGHPTERLEGMLADAAPCVVVTTGALWGRSGLRHSAVCLMEDLRSHKGPRMFEPVATVPRALVYMIYTSGSTGRPKGVLIQQQGLLNLVCNQIDDFGLTPGDRVLQFASVGFDASVSEIFVTLCAGATLVLLPRARLMEGEDLVRFMEEEGITVATLPPPLLAILDPHRVPSLRTVIAAGDMCTAALARAWSGGRRFLNAYGPTEASVCATVHQITGDPGESPSLPIGRPLDNVRILVLDRSLRPCPIGVSGEICIAGAGVARGYHGAPERTASVFVPDPSGSTPGGRMYRTGDRGRWLPDGTLECQGRIDMQVKIRGSRVEPGEVECCLRTHPAVADAAVIAQGDEGRKQLVGYAMLRTGMEADPHGLRRHAAARLPDFMVPSRVVVVERLPLSASGKVDRAALAAMPVETVTEERRHEEARTATEAALVRIWQEVLGVERVGVTENFFELGGDSILSIQVVSRAREAGVYLSVRQIFQYPTIRELAGAQGQERVAPAEEGVLEGAVPLTPIQEWFFGEGFAEANHWNQSVVVEAGVALGHEEVEAMVEAVVRHHDVLRMRYRRTATGWEQWMAGMGDALPVVYEDLRVVGEAGLEACLGRWQRSLDLEGGPVLRVVVVELPGRQVVGVMVHHLVIDGVSWRILLEDMETACRQVRSGQSVRLPPKTASFRQWATALRAYAGSTAARSEVATWASLALVQLNISPVPCDHWLGPNDEASRQDVVVSCSPEETARMLHGATIVPGAGVQAILLTALMRVLWSWTTGRVACCALEGHGREEGATDLDLTRTVGWFTASYPFTCESRRGEPARQTLGRVVESLDHMARHGLSYGVLRYLTPDPDVRARLSHLHPPEVSFNYFGQIDERRGRDSLFRPTDDPTGPQCAPGNLRPHIVSVNARIAGGRLVCVWSFSRSLHAAVTMERVVSQFRAELDAIMRDPPAEGIVPPDGSGGKDLQDLLDGLDDTV